MLWHKVSGHQLPSSVPPSAVSSGLKLECSSLMAGAHQDPASLLGVLQASTLGPCQMLAESAPTYRCLPTSSSGSAQVGQGFLIVPYTYRGHLAWSLRTWPLGSEGPGFVSVLPLLSSITLGKGQTLGAFASSCAKWGQQ